MGVPAPSSPSGHSGSAPSPKGLGHSASVLNAGEPLKWEDWLDRVLDGRGCDPGDFARSAIGNLPRVEATVRYPTSSAWPPEVRAEMEAIRKGEL